VNDAYGHGVGDAVLAVVAAELAGCIRSFDAACRIGGEEFAVILPNTGRPEARGVAERIRAGIARDGRDGSPAVTVSCGVATHPCDAATARALVRCADDAMYEAKHAGRNTIGAWSGS
jgi:diguanylate cyclase (GGDEF)-like protein